MAYVYILYSCKLGRFYIGSTELFPTDRLELHLKKVYGEKQFTARTDDWKLFFIIQCDTIDQARRVEIHIKRMKSKTYINNLVKYPEISGKLLERYK